MKLFEYGAGRQELVLAFGSFRLLMGQRVLLEADKPVRLGSRALEILIALVERPGELIGKHALLARVWPDTAVVEDNLTVHIAALRRALGDGVGTARYIVNTPGRGYRFVAPVERQLAPRAPGLPPRVARLIGREAEIAQLSRAGRLTTITGPGGVGKSAVALEAAARLDPAARSIDLADAAAIGTLVERPGLLVLDNCDLMIDALAPLIPAWLNAAPGLQLIVTSREALRLEGEQVLRLAPLDPSASVELFVERAAGGFVPTEETAPAVARLCRALDGIPLALILAAAQIGIFGFAGLAARLHDIEGPALRNAPARHRSLRASFEWSRQRLAAAETDALAILAGFADDFRFDEAVAAVPAELFAGLVAKSLIAVDLAGPIARYRLFRTIRPFVSPRHGSAARRPA